MNTTDTVLLYILTVLLAILVLLAIAIVVAILRLINSIKRVVDRTEGVMDSVETAAEAFKDAQGPLAMLKIFRNVNTGYGDESCNVRVAHVVVDHFG